MRELVLIGLLVVPVQVSGQRILRDAWSDLQQGAADIGYVWTAPMRLGAGDLPALGLVAGATGLTMIYDDNIQAWLSGHPQSASVDALAQFRQGKPGEELGDIWMLIRASGVVWLAGLAVDSHTMREGALGCVSAGMAQSFARRNVSLQAGGTHAPRLGAGPL